MIKLYHYSNRDFTGFIKPDFFGLNDYSRNSKRISQVKRSYFYIDPANREFYFSNNKYIYITEIIESKLYNIDIDPAKLIKPGKDIYYEVKKRGYMGLLGNNGFNCGILFYPARIKTRLIRGKND